MTLTQAQSIATARSIYDGARYAATIGTHGAPIARLRPLENDGTRTRATPHATPTHYHAHKRAHTQPPAYWIALEDLLCEYDLYDHEGARVHKAQRALVCVG